ncbi:MAG: hypothetical protein ABI434_24065 [Burkholderiaceae bacterium]
MAHKLGQVKGNMTYREGEGVEMPIPTGPCEIEITELDVTLTWVDGDTHGATAIPLADYHQHVRSGLLVVR